MKYTKAQQKLKKSLIKALHISKRYVNYYKDSENEYRELLKKHFGVKSSKELSIDNLIALVEYFNFKRDKLEIKVDKATKNQILTLKKLWKDYARDKSDRALIWFLKKYNGSLVIKPEDISFKAAQKAIIALKKTLKKDIND